ncbi:MAG: hypothetical protein ABGZ24_01750, partial [Fuerstiella sp.]
ETRTVNLVVSKVTSTFLQRQFPDYFFLNVRSARSLFGIPVSQYVREVVWAVSRTGGANWNFRFTEYRCRKVFAFLARNQKAIRNIEDAEHVSRVFGELNGMGTFFSEAAGEHEQIDEFHW